MLEGGNGGSGETRKEAAWESRAAVASQAGVGVDGVVMVRMRSWGVKSSGCWERQGLWERSFNNGSQASGPEQ